jgi:1-acyl-sn-glycerol-3-phosphate acyltransferase
MKVSSWLAREVLKILGWKYVVNIDPLPEKAVVIMAPHTSNWDFIIGKLCFMAIEKKPFFLIKKEWFFFPVGWVLKKWGGIPVDRSNPGELVNQVVKAFEIRSTFLLVITPEGTRKPVKHWKKGFYRISVEAHVPILISFLDFKKKIGCIDQVFWPTNDYEKDLRFLADYYKNITARHPKNFVLPEP